MKRSVWLLIAFFLLPWSLSAAARDDAKNSYLKKANQELQEWNTKVDKLQKRAEKAGARTRVELDQALKTVRENLAVFRQKVTEVQGSGENGWNTLGRRADDAFKDVKHAYWKAASFLEKDKHKEKP